jgi:hypothetical protein
MQWLHPWLDGWFQSAGRAAALPVNLDSSVMVDAYVRVEESCRNAPDGEKKMGQNDMWTAATAQSTRPLTNRRGEGRRKCNVTLYS